MNLVFEIPFDKNQLLEKYLFLYKMQNRPYQLSFKVVVFLFIVFSCIGYYGYDNLQNPFFFFSFALLFVVIFLYVVISSSKNRYKTIINHLAKLQSKEEVRKYELNESGLVFKDSIQHFEKRWEGFTSYALKNNYIMIVSYERIDSSIIIGKEEVGENMFFSIERFLNQKLPQKKL